jgi:hypothetical protein
MFAKYDSFQRAQTLKQPYASNILFKVKNEVKYLAVNVLIPVAFFRKLNFRKSGNLKYGYIVTNSICTSQETFKVIGTQNNYHVSNG